MKTELDNYMATYLYMIILITAAIKVAFMSPEDLLKVCTSLLGTENKFTDSVVSIGYIGPGI